MKIIDGVAFDTQIGEGNFADVFLCSVKYEDRITDKMRNRLRKDRAIACKIMALVNITKKIKTYLIREIEIMEKLNSKYILRFIEAKETQNNLYLFVEYCNGGDLRRLVNLKGGKLDEDYAKIILRKIAKGLKYLNKNDIIHRDLKLENILLHFPDQDQKK